jgi:type II secretory pathway pseudopilin PulG
MVTRRIMCKDERPVRDGFLKTLLERVQKPTDSERGDTLVEVLIALLVIGLTATALLAGFATSISASTEHRNLATLDTVLKSYVESATYQLQQQQNFLFVPNPPTSEVCPTAASYTSAIAAPAVPSPTFSAFVQSVQVWNGSGWSPASSCNTTQSPPAPELIQAQATGAGASESLYFVVNNPAYLPAPPTANAAPTFTSANQATEVTGNAFTFPITATGPPAPTITESGALPSGVSFTLAGGTYELTGTPAAGSAGTYPISFTASNGILPNVTQNPFTLTIDSAPSMPPTGSAQGALSAPFSYQVVASGNPSPTFSESGALPTGITMSSSGLFSGTPTAAGTFVVTITASNGVGTNATQSFTLTTAPATAPTGITPTSCSVKKNTAGWSTTVSAVGGFPTPSTSASGLPGWLTFTDNGNGTGTLNGNVPSSTSGSPFSFSIKAQNAAGSVTNTYTLTIVNSAGTC